MPASQQNEKIPFLPLVFRDFPTSLALKAEKELNETSGNKKTCLKKLKELISAESKTYCTDDDFLIMFLRVRKYNVKRAFQTLKNYSSVRRAQKNHFESIEFEKVKKMLDSGVVGLLPNRDREGRAIMFFDASKFSSATCSYDDVMPAVHAITHFALSFPATQVNGICFLSNSSIPSLEVFQLFCMFAKTLGPTVNDLPARIKRIDCVNVNIVFRLAFSILQTLLPTKILRRAHLHGDQKDALIKVFPPEILPEEFGGKISSLRDTYKDWINDFEKFVPTFKSTCAFYQN
ncbi:Retinaldehyde-binding protein 1 like protein [Argiope bruennichi]|uniref:Retinaldehyde-binding protein 1 like protein n=1 Tax=Argiope bruennichi TaxID=94029 RepID=A0A8T0ERS4_ARGBR|nr:Retinaldehyde-binding protein 1 like protein [Argiope bruennichi]